MAKKATKARIDTSKKITTPTLYGSHSCMIENSIEAPEGMVACKDDEGVYLTYRNRLDNGLADSCRYDLNYRKSLCLK